MITIKSIKAIAGYLISRPRAWYHRFVRQLVIQDLRSRGLSISYTAIVQGSNRITCFGNSNVGAYTIIWCGNDLNGFLKDGHLQIGNNVYIGDHCCIRASGCPIVIGNDVLIANGVTIVSANHGIKTGELIRLQPWESPGQQVTIGNDVWIGAHATILPGATVSDGSIIAAGSVVRSFVPKNEIWGGVPARKLRER